MTKWHFEAFALYSWKNDSKEGVNMNGQYNVAKSIFRQDISVDVKGGYAFSNEDCYSLLWPSIEYEDDNSENRARISTAECVPLVVATPDSFPTPARRQLSTLSYTPTYTTIQQQ
jgi:hypothetical protein